MYPIICQIGPFTVYSYGLAMALAFLVCIFLARIQAPRAGIDPNKVFDLSFLVLIGGIIGGRFLYVVLNLSYFLEYPKEISMLHRGGLAWFGAITFATMAGIIFFKRNKWHVLKSIDFFAPYIALGHAIGRIGCFLNGCCYGRPASWGIYFPAHDARLIPTQLISTLYLIIIFLILRFLQKKPHKPGEIFFSYLLFSSLARFLNEFLRADTPEILVGLTIFQIISVFLILGSLYAIIFIKGRR